MICKSIQFVDGLLQIVFDNEDHEEDIKRLFKVNITAKINRVRKYRIEIYSLSQYCK